MRITPLKPIEKNGLHGFGFSVHFDRDNQEQPETATPSATNEGGSDAKSAYHRSFENHLIDRRRLDAGEAERQPLVEHQNAPAESATDTISAPIQTHDRPSSSSDHVTAGALSSPAAPAGLFSPWHPRSFNPNGTGE